MSGVDPVAEEEVFGDGTGRRRGKRFVGNGILFEVAVAVGVETAAPAGRVCPLFHSTRALLVDWFDLVAGEATQEREEAEDDFC